MTAHPTGKRGSIGVFDASHGVLPHNPRAGVG